MENIISLNPIQESSILELASMIKKKVNINLSEECKSGGYIPSKDETFTDQRSGTDFLNPTSQEIENAIEAIIHCIYRDVLKSYEETKKEVNCDKQILSYHIFNEVDFIAKTLFPNIKFA